MVSKAGGEGIVEQKKKDSLYRHFADGIVRRCSFQRLLATGGAHTHGGLERVVDPPLEAYNPQSNSSASDSHYPKG